MRDFIENLMSYVIAILRLILLTIITFLGGLHQILFNNVEVCSVMLYNAPLRKDRKYLSYINKLNMGNMDLMQPTDIDGDEDEGPYDDGPEGLM